MRWVGSGNGEAGSVDVAQLVQGTKRFLLQIRYNLLELLAVVRRGSQSLFYSLLIDTSIDLRLMLLLWLPTTGAEKLLSIWYSASCSVLWCLLVCTGGLRTHGDSRAGLMFGYQREKKIKIKKGKELVSFRVFYLILRYMISLPPCVLFRHSIRIRCTITD